MRPRSRPSLPRKLTGGNAARVRRSDQGSARKCQPMKVRKVQLSDLTESQAHKLRLLKAALEQVMGHEVQTMTLSYTDSGSPRLRVGFSVTLQLRDLPFCASDLCSEATRR